MVVIAVEAVAVDSVAAAGDLEEEEPADHGDDASQYAATDRQRPG